uniref:Uncharacterized protein n=1 Tax=Picea glauca TaxID=3330 RepID=A0A101M572_PICGL|nr:hypothetical protein ABT39_MTgene1143 [Picea glauca]
MLRVVSVLYVLHFPIIHLLSRKMPSSIRRERVSYGMHCPKRMWRGPVDQMEGRLRGLPESGQGRPLSMAPSLLQAYLAGR